jgi:hypothetical protein
MLTSNWQQRRLQWIITTSSSNCWQRLQRQRQEGTALLRRSSSSKLQLLLTLTCQMLQWCQPSSRQQRLLLIMQWSLQPVSLCHRQTWQRQQQVLLLALPPQMPSNRVTQRWRMPHQNSSSTAGRRPQQQQVAPPLAQWTRHPKVQQLLLLVPRAWQQWQPPQQLTLSLAWRSSVAA